MRNFLKNNWVLVVLSLLAVFVIVVWGAVHRSQALDNDRIEIQIDLNDPESFSGVIELSAIPLLPDGKRHVFNRNLTLNSDGLTGVSLSRDSFEPGLYRLQASFLDADGMRSSPVNVDRWLSIVPVWTYGIVALMLLMAIAFRQVRYGLVIVGLTLAAVPSAQWLQVDTLTVDFNEAVEEVEVEDSDESDDEDSDESDDEDSDESDDEDSDESDDEDSDESNDEDSDESDDEDSDESDDEDSDESDDEDSDESDDEDSDESDGEDSDESDDEDYDESDDEDSDESDDEDPDGSDDEDSDEPDDEDSDEPDDEDSAEPDDEDPDGSDDEDSDEPDDEDSDESDDEDSDESDDEDSDESDDEDSDESDDEDSDEPDDEDSDEPDDEDSDEPDDEDSDEPDDEDSDEPDDEDSDEPDDEDSDEPDGEDSDESDGEDSDEPDDEDSDEPDDEDSDEPDDEDSDEPDDEDSDETSVPLGSGSLSADGSAIIGSGSVSIAEYATPVPDGSGTSAGEGSSSSGSSSSNNPSSSSGENHGDDSGSDPSNSETPSSRGEQGSSNETSSDKNMEERFLEIVEAEISRVLKEDDSKMLRVDSVELNEPDASVELNYTWQARPYEESFYRQRYLTLKSIDDVLLEFSSEEDLEEEDSRRDRDRNSSGRNNRNRDDAEMDRSAPNSEIIPIESRTQSVSIGFPFNFYTETYEELYVSPYGFISFEPITSTKWQDEKSALILPFGIRNPRVIDMLDVRKAVIEAQSFGIYPDRTLAIRWTVPIVDSEAQLQVQTQIYEADDSLHFLYPEFSYEFFKTDFDIGLKDHPDYRLPLEDVQFSLDKIQSGYPPLWMRPSSPFENLDNPLPTLEKDFEKSEISYRVIITPKSEGFTVTPYVSALITPGRPSPFKGDRDAFVPDVATPQSMSVRDAFPDATSSGNTTLYPGPDSDLRWFSVPDISFTDLDGNAPIFDKATQIQIFGVLPSLPTPFLAEFDRTKKTVVLYVEPIKGKYSNLELTGGAFYLRFNEKVDRGTTTKDGGRSFEVPLEDWEDGSIYFEMNHLNPTPGIFKIQAQFTLI